MTRRNPFSILSLLGVVSTAGIQAAQAAPQGKGQRPNVIFILMDDAGYGDFGCYGQTKTETPNIDALAQRGILFSDMYSGAPISAPARCTLLTGLHAGHAQVRSNDEMLSRGNVWSLKAMLDDPSLEGQAPLKEGTVTLGTVMRDAGYRTAMIGKWGLGGPSSQSIPNTMGFDFFYGYLCQRVAQCYYPQYLYRNTQREKQDNPLMDLGDRFLPGEDPYSKQSYERFKGKDYSGDALYREVEKFVTDNSRDPFFLMWTTTVPHSALQAPDEMVDYYVKKFGDEEPRYGGKGYFPCRYPRATYAAMITYFDQQVGKLVERLKQLGIYDNTIIFFTSDNGPSHNAFTSTEWFDCAHPFRSTPGWTKRSLHEGGIRMPFIVSWGDRIKGQKSDHIGYFPDVMPTLCDIARVKAPRTDGISLYGLMTGRRQAEHEALYFEFPPFKKSTANGWLSVRMKQWKGLVVNVADGNTRMELYDIVADPKEENNLASQHPDIVRRMWQFIRRNHTEAENPLFKMKITYPEDL